MCCTIHAQKEQQVTHEIHTQEGLQCRSFGKSGCGSSAGYILRVDIWANLKATSSNVVYFRLISGAKWSPFVSLCTRATFRIVLAARAGSKIYKKLAKMEKEVMWSHTKFKKKGARHDDTKKLRCNTQFRFSGGGSSC